MSKVVNDPDIEDYLRQAQLLEQDIDFTDPNLDIPTCVFCQNEFSLKDGRTPYIMPCEEHTCCKSCLQLAR